MIQVFDWNLALTSPEMQLFLATKCRSFKGMYRLKLISSERNSGFKGLKLSRLDESNDTMFANSKLIWSLGLYANSKGCVLDKMKN